jgi:hypothetical protein
MVEGLDVIKKGLGVMVEPSNASFIFIQRGNYVEVSSNKTMIIIDDGVVVITLNLSTHAYLALGPLTFIFCQAITDLLFLKTHFLKMYAPCTTTSHVHMIYSPLQPTYVCMLHHYIPRILAKV